MTIVSEAMPRPAAAEARAATVRRFALTDTVFHALTRASAILVLVILGGVAISLVVGAWPALSAFGASFLATQAWNPVTENFGALAPIYGTVVTSAVAILIAVPIGIGIAVFLTELCPRPLRRPIGIAVELLAGIPSIIYGIWGLFVFAPFLQVSLQPLVIGLFKGVPVLENKPLARALYKLAKVNDAIPETLYRLVAEVLAYVYSLRQRAAYLEGRA